MKNILHVKLLLKITQEYVNSHFTFVFSLLFSLLFLAYSYNFSSNSWRPVVLLFLLFMPLPRHMLPSSIYELKRI